MKFKKVWLKELDGKLKFPEHELFMFCVLTGWHEMAMMFCSEGRVRNTSIFDNTYS